MPAPVRPPSGHKPAGAPKPAAAKKSEPAPPPVKDADEGGDDGPPSRIAWFVGWVIVPGVVFGGIFTAGVAVGAHFPDSLITRAVTWIAGFF